jgi:hypothetical protein
MANNEVLQLRGRLASQKDIAYSLKKGIEIDRAAARVILDAFQPVDSIEIDELEIVCKRIVKAVRQYHDAQDTIGQLTAALGVEE